MPPRRRAAAPIPIDVEAIRRKLAEGKIVRVGISRSAQFPEGGTGRVRQVGNPEIDGEEYVQVELSLNGTRDILPFTPADLTPASRAKPPVGPPASQPPARTRPSRATVPGLPTPTQDTVPPATPPPARTRASHATAPGLPTPTQDTVPPATPPSARTKASRATAPGLPAPVQAPEPPVSPPPASVPSGAASARSAPSVSTATRASTSAPDTKRDVTVGDITARDVPARDVPARDGTASDGAGNRPTGDRATDDRAAGGRAKNPRGSRRTPPVSITVATTDAEPIQWRIEARVGARVVLRHGSVTPARVWELVQQLQEPTLITAVGGILDEQRKAAQARADALAAELAKVQAELEALPRQP